MEPNEFKSFRCHLYGRTIQSGRKLRNGTSEFIIIPKDMESDLDKLKAKADKKGADVIVSLVSGTCKAVLPEHRRQIETEEDFEGIFYTDDHVRYCRLPRVVV